MYSLGIKKRDLKLVFALGLAIVLTLVQSTQALSVSVVSDRVGDEFIWGISAGDILRYVDRRDGDYVCFVDIINVRIRLTKEFMLVTFHVLGEIPTEHAEGVDLDFGILASSTKDSFGRVFDPVEYPWFVVAVLYESVPVPIVWESWLFVVLSPDERSHYDLSFDMKKRNVDISVPTLLLPMTSFYWQGFTYYKNTKLRDNGQILHDQTDINCLT